MPNKEREAELSNKTLAELDTLKAEWKVKRREGGGQTMREAQEWLWAITKAQADWHIFYADLESLKE